MRKENSQGRLIVLSGPSGAGKSTVIARVLRQRPDIYFSVSFTTRSPRAGEKDGVNYHFVSREEFEAMIARDAFLEYAQYVDHFYGTSQALVQEKLDAGTDVLLDIEVQGAAKIRQRRPDAALIFLCPPSLEELSRRLRGRGTDSEEVIAGRLQRAREEYKQIPGYDYLVINDQVDRASEELLAILAAERCRVKYRMELLEGV